MENGFNIDGCGDPDCEECGGEENGIPEWFEDECRWDLQYESGSALSNVLTATFQSRGLLQAHRRLALASATNDRLGAASPLRGTDMGGLFVLLEDHLLIGKTRMPGAKVTAETASRFAEQGWVRHLLTFCARSAHVFSHVILTFLSRFGAGVGGQKSGALCEGILRHC